MQKALDDLTNRLNDLEARVEGDEQVLQQTKDLSETNRLDIEDILAKMHDMNQRLSGLDNI